MYNTLGFVGKKATRWLPVYILGQIKQVACASLWNGEIKLISIFRSLSKRGRMSIEVFLYGLRPTRFQCSLSQKYLADMLADQYQ